MTISEVSVKYDISIDTLRYYEKIGLIRDVKRKNGIRNYDALNLRTIEFILCMRKAGLSLEFLKEYMDLYAAGDETIVKRKELLIKQREIIINKITDLQSSLNLLNYKIDNYEKLAEEKGL